MESRLFHAIVVMGLSFGAGCGGAEATGHGEGAADASKGGADSAVADGSHGADATSSDTGAETGTADGAAGRDASGDAQDAAPDAYGHEDDAGTCVCPGTRTPAPCCPPAYGACSPWPCYV